MVWKKGLKMNVIIRKLESKDTEQLLALCDEIREHHREILGGYFLPQDDEFEKNNLTSLLEDDKAIVLVAVDETGVEGLLLAEKRIAPYLEMPKIGYIHNFGVFKKTRGKGIARLLMDAFYVECQKCGIQEIKLGVFNKNRIAYNFYEKYGFEAQEQKMSLMVK